MLNGNPLVHRAPPEVCQPPMNAFNTPLALPASARPLPTGSSAIQLRLNWWVVSKSETARARFGEKALAMRVPTRPMFWYPYTENPTRDAADVMSMDFE